ncbi:MAG: response regulator transcription factor [Betaproteobacteria bacterium]|nr:response regulator transcription factor [Betaproteobacteria bacterium]
MTQCVVAEDEDLLRAELVSQLKRVWPDLHIVAEASDGGTALEEIAAHQPAVAFLDIRMPGLTGIEVAAAARESSPDTEIVFVTAYDKHAIDAFEHGAIDYLMKPVAQERLAATVHRIQKRLASGTAPTQPDAGALKSALGSPAREPLTWITASAGRETRLIMIDDVIYFQSDNKYTVVMTAEGEALIRKPIRELLCELDPAQFKQIHRSTLVNFKAIQSVTRDEFGKGILKLRKRPETLTVSQPYMVLFRNM